MRNSLPLSASAIVLGVLGLTGCPSPQGNPDVLWLAPGNASETMVQLSETEPPLY